MSIPMTSDDAAPVEQSAPIPIVALDVGSLSAALELADAIPRADFFKVGLQLYTAAGPGVVHRLKERGHRVFLDLKLHDIPNTVAGAVRSAAALSVDLLTVHAVGGGEMLRAASETAAAASHSPRLLAVTVLTSLRASDLAEAWGLPVVDTGMEAARLAGIADGAGVYGVVASLHEVASIRASTRRDLPVLTPGIRLPGDAAGDQSRIGTPGDAARAGADYIVLGRTVTAAADPGAAYDRVLAMLADASFGIVRP
jgi:orotidine-5'-phosphate decarboxylase